jgi:hypothetical protein
MLIPRRAHATASNFQCHANKPTHAKTINERPTKKSSSIHAGVVGGSGNGFAVFTPGAPFAEQKFDT